MDDEEELVFEPDRDPFSQTAEPDDALTRCICWGWLDGPEDERAGEPDLFENMTVDSRLQGLDVGGNVGKFRHGTPIIDRMRTFRILVGGWILGGAAIVLLSLGDVQPVVARPAPLVYVPAVPQQRTPILIPVRGIAPTQLRDTFTELRGGGRRSHGAMDILAPRGTEVVAAVDGKVRKIFTSKAGGLSVYQFDVNEERVYYYAHLDRYADGLHEGQFLEQGQILGYVGTTGNAPAGTPHLHFAIEELTAEKLWWKGTPLNPYPLLAR